MTTQATIGVGFALALGISGCGYPDLPPIPADESTSSTTESAESTGDSDSASGVDPIAVTYHADIRPLVEGHCMECHQPGNIGPFSLTSFEEVHALREAIVLSVEGKTMPPWQPGPGCQDYANDTSLSDAEIELFGAWLDGGAPEGNPDSYVPLDIPEPPGMSRIDVTLQMPEPYLPQKQPDDYRCFLIDWPYDETTYISGFAAAPDQLNTVHHIIAFGVEPDQVAEYEALDEADPGVGYTCFGGPGASVSSVNSVANWLGSWAPGGAGGDFPDSTGIRVAPGSKIALQVHYNTLVSDIKPDRSSVHFKVDTEVEHPAVMLLWADPSWLSGGMHIPAGSPSTVHVYQDDPALIISVLTDVISAGEPFRIYQAGHHMHTLGTRGQQTVIRADSSNTCLLEIPRWDFNWQQGYRFAEPVVFNPGDELRMACEWNNEAGKEHVNWGDGTQDEMCLGVLYATGM